MRLRVNLIANGKYYAAGTDIEDDEVPAFAMRYHQAEEVSPRSETQASSSGFTEDEKPKSEQRTKYKKPTYVLRNGKYIPLGEANPVVGEPLYYHRPKSFGRTEAFIKFGSFK